VQLQLTLRALLIKLGFAIGAQDVSRYVQLQFTLRVLQDEARLRDRSDGTSSYNSLSGFFRMKPGFAIGYQ
jgi:hypothetical protein